jgi:ribonucleoside-diphosphate reductase alpha chain
MRVEPTSDQLTLSESAVRVLEKRYLQKNADGETVETPAALFRRVAHNISTAETFYAIDEEKRERWEEAFYGVMARMEFIPNSPTLMNAGTDIQQLSACFVLPVDDSMEGIFDSIKHTAIIHKSGGGTGFSFSRVRPRNDVVNSTRGVSSGPISFMTVFDAATETVKQGGRRRGANMAILRVDHPDILHFIGAKRRNDRLNNFNISVAVTDKFMEAVKNGGDYELVNPRTGKVVDTLSAGMVFETIVEGAWRNGEPGIVFIDEINRHNPTPRVGMIESTNPCGEQPLLPYESCNLGSINLSRFVTGALGEGEIDYEALGRCVATSVRFLDNVIDMNNYPLEQIDDLTKSNRKIGLGVMGFADLLIRMGIPYDDDRAVEVAEELMEFIQKSADEASRDLAEERGAFPNFALSVYADRGELPIRNATRTTIAPTGTISIIADTTSGVEPVFALAFVRNVMDNDELVESNTTFEAVAREYDFYSDELIKRVAKTGSVQGDEEVPQRWREIFKTSHDISPEAHTRIQAAFQKYTDNAVSKTVNFSREATVEEVRSVFMLAYDTGCKGVTIYRDGSKENQVLAFNQKEDSSMRFLRAVKERPETLEGFTTRMKTGMGHLYVTVTEYEGRPFEVFATIGKSGRSTAAKAEAVGRLVSLALRSGVKVGDIVKQLKGIGGEYPVFQPGGLVLSIPDAIARILEKRYLKNANGTNAPSRTASLLGEKCPECSQTISFEEGCMTCHFCGFTKCG